MNIQEEWELHKPKKKTWGRLLRVVFGCRRSTGLIFSISGSCRMPKRRSKGCLTIPVLRLKSS